MRRRLRHGIAGLGLAACKVMAQGQSPKGLPDAPSVLQVTRQRAFAVNVSVNEKYSIHKDMLDTALQAGFDWRFLHSRFRAGVAYGHSIRSGEDSVSGSVNVKLLEFGQLR